MNFWPLLVWMISFVALVIFIEIKWYTVKGVKLSEKSASALAIVYIVGIVIFLIGGLIP